MDTLLKAIRTQLTDGTLNATVPLIDIHSSFNKEESNYPCIIMTAEAGGAGIDITGINRATVTIDIYSNVNKIQCYTIAALVKGLLHNQERGITTAACLVHVAYEAKVEDVYNQRLNVWLLRVTYEFIFSASGILIASGASGAIYADASNVTVAAGKKIGEFSGKLELRVGLDVIHRTKAERFGTDVYCNNGIAQLIVEKVVFSPAKSLGLLYGITANGSDTLADDSTSSTSYTITQATTPAYLQILFRATKTDDGKALEIEADRALCPTINIPFTKKDYTIIDCEFLCLGDGSDNVVKVSIEN